MSYHNIEELLTRRITSLTDVDRDNKSDLLEAVSEFYRIRHDIIHYFLKSFLCGGNFDSLSEKKVEDVNWKTITIQSDKRFKDIAKQTPDLVLFRKDSGSVFKDEAQDENDEVLIIDVCVSLNKIEQEGKKLEKYKLLKTVISDNSKPDRIINVWPFMVDSSFNNINESILELKNVIGFTDLNVEEFPTVAIRSLLDTLKRSNKTILDLINDKTLLDKYLKEQFGLSSEEIQPTYVDKATLENDIKLIKKKVKHIFTSTDKRDMSSLDPFESLNGEESSILCNSNNERLISCLSDEPLMDKMSEKRTDPQSIISAIESIKNEISLHQDKKMKPSIHTFAPFTNNYIPQDSVFSEFRPEQTSILNLMELFNKKIMFTDHRLIAVSDFCSKVLGLFRNNTESSYNKAMFNDGIIFNEHVNSTILSMYNEYKLNCKKTGTPAKSISFECKNNESFISVIRENGFNESAIPDDDQSKAFRNKMVRLNMSKGSKELQDFWKQSNSGQKNLKSWKDDDRNRCPPFRCFEDVDKYMTLMSERIKPELISQYTETGNTQFDELLFNEGSPDSKLAQDFKRQMSRDNKIIYEEMKEFPAFWLSYRQFHIQEQLSHFTQNSLPSNSFCVFNSGMRNVCFIVNNSYHDAGKDVGKAFMSFGYTDNLDEINGLYGDIKYQDFKINGKIYYFFATNWRRLTATKTTFLRDQFFVTLSTGFTALKRNQKRYMKLTSEEGHNEFIHQFYTLKVIISLCSNQRTAELLADFRYAIMASFSEYSDIGSFIKSKFCLPLTNHIEMWVFSRMNFLKLFVENYHTLKEKMHFKIPQFVGKRRLEESIGGEFELPSLWTGYRIFDLQDLLDDLFLYVHTAKEPSSMHHENVKAINTILEYQNQYNSLSESRKKGHCDNIEEFKYFLTDKNIIGFDKKIVIESVKHTLTQIKTSTIDGIIKEVLNEPLSYLSSTKAAIPEYERSVATRSLKKRKKKKIENLIISGNEIRHADTKEEDLEVKSVFTKSKTSLNLTGTLRAKVHDGLLDLLNRKELHTVYDLAKWNILYNKGRVEADICIKAQFGAKREFYVLNLGAKAMARIIENTFHRLCMQLENEMISVPGDKKLLVMQEKINAQMAKKKQNQIVYFTNGDCTKWSAAETMECLHSTIMSLEGLFPSDFLDLLKSIMFFWGKKDVVIPSSILLSTYKIHEDLPSNYLKDNTFKIRSTQNFLQGMFNYLSSFKAVCSSNYAIKKWLEFNPRSDISIDHLEHSDDYVLMINCSSEDELRRFRAFHRIIMKCHGFNDSVKKTNTQKFLMEFISLVSMNGHMTYPQIKKSKEVGLNIGCTGYRDDVDTALSRVGEAVRIGLPFDSAFFMQRVHLSNIYRAYSLFKGQVNSYQDIKCALSTPVELFGIPDTHPIFSMLCKGSVNNFRLSRYHKKSKALLEKLFLLEMDQQLNDNDWQDKDLDEQLRFFHPGYSFDRTNKLIKKIRDKIGLKDEELTNFWSKHKTYNFVKPKNMGLFKEWLKCMYYRYNFSLSYSRLSRAQMTLRLSTFTRSKCIRIFKKNEDEEHMTIRKYIDDFLNGEITPISTIGEIESIYKKDFTVLYMKSLTNSDSTSGSIYSMLDNSKCIEQDFVPRSTIASKTPVKINWMRTENSPSDILQYIFNFEDFCKDIRKPMNIASLDNDRLSIQRFYEVELGDNTPLPIIKSVFNDIMLSKEKQNLCMTYFKDVQTLEEFVKKTLESGTSATSTYKIYTHGIAEAINPHTNEIYYKKLYDYTKNALRLIIDDAVLLFTLLKFGYKYTIKETKDILDNLLLNPDIGENKLITLKDSLRSNSLHMLHQIDCTPNEMKSFAFLKALMLDDPSDINELISEKFAFSYRYLLVDQRLSGIFKESVRFMYDKTVHVAYLDKTDCVILFADTSSKSNLINSYLIALKLFGKITQTFMEKNLGKLNAKKLMELKKIRINSEVERYVDGLQNIISGIRRDRNKFRLVNREDWPKCVNTDKEQYPDFPVYQANLEKDATKLEFVTINRPVTIDFETATVSSGDEKLYTLPILSASQSNCGFLEKDYNLNGLSINWWLRSNRIYDFIKGRDIDVKTDQFTKIKGFSLTRTVQDFEERRAKILNYWENLVARKPIFENSGIFDTPPDATKEEQGERDPIESQLEFETSPTKTRTEGMFKEMIEDIMKKKREETLSQSRSSFEGDSMILLYNKLDVERTVYPDQDEYEAKRVEILKEMSDELTGMFYEKFLGVLSDDEIKSRVSKMCQLKIEGIMDEWQEDNKIVKVVNEEQFLFVKRSEGCNIVRMIRGLDKIKDNPVLLEWENCTIKGMQRYRIEEEIQEIDDFTIPTTYGYIKQPIEKSQILIEDDDERLTIEKYNMLTKIKTNHKMKTGEDIPDEEDENIMNDIHEFCKSKVQERSVQDNVEFNKKVDANIEKLRLTARKTTKILRNLVYEWNSVKERVDHNLVAKFLSDKNSTEVRNMLELTNVTDGSIGSVKKVSDSVSEANNVKEFEDYTHEEMLELIINKLGFSPELEIADVDYLRDQFELIKMSEDINVEVGIIEMDSSEESDANAEFEFITDFPQDFELGGKYKAHDDSMVNLSQFDFVMPEKIFEDRISSYRLPESVSRVFSKGDPTRYLIEKNFLTSFEFMKIGNKERIILLKQAAKVLEQHEKCRPIENYISLVVAERIYKSLILLDDVELDFNTIIQPKKSGLKQFKQCYVDSDRFLRKALRVNCFIDGIPAKQVDPSKYDCKKRMPTLTIPLREKDYINMELTQEESKNLVHTTSLEIITKAYDSTKITLTKGSGTIEDLIDSMLSSDED